MAKVFLRAYNREIETMVDRGQLDEAIAHCHHILKTFPKHVETYRLLGKAYLEAKRYGDAVDVFSRVLASVPNDFVSHVGLSIIRDEENKLDDAIWHMERAFETQPSNSAIQSELQRLYGRRDGVAPPRIRMTRGALAHMYVQGELYPQAISEIKSVLKEDPGRNDMQALLARAHFKSGAKNDAVDAALALLQRLPYALDGNRVLVEVLSADRNENAQSYRQRVVELDPYAAQVAGSVFQSNEVADAAVSLERLDWNGQPVGMGTGADWRESQGIGLESGRSRDEQPDWLKGSAGAVTPPPLSQPSSPFDFETPATPAQPADDIPDFMKAAGWGQSTGTFDESKSMFADEDPATGAEPLAQGDLPDWVKAMKPPEPEAATPAEDEELPDWINQIGTGALGASTAQPEWMGQSEESQETFPAPADDQPDWLKGFGETQESAQPAQDQPDWVQGFGSASDLAPEPAQTDTPDWLKGLGSEPDVTPQPAETETPDWLKGLSSEPDARPEPAATETADWLKGLGSETEATPQAAESDSLDWLTGVGSEPETPAVPSDDDWMKQLASTPEEPTTVSKDFDFLNELPEETVTQVPQDVLSPASNVDDLGKSEQERDDSFAWLENLAAKQGATEGLLTTPEERLEQEPEWVRQAKGLTGEPSVSQPPVNAEELGKSEQERDDSFAWLENLAAKQGATEGLLTKPEERMEQEPEWVRQAKGLTGEPPAAQPPVSAEELGKSEQERDDSFAWLENLAAKQGATEGLLTKPEERMEQEPEWVRQAKGLASETPVSESPVNAGELGSSEPERDDSFAWLENLSANQGGTEAPLTEPEDRLQEEPEWVDETKFAAPEAPLSQPPANVDELGKSEQERDDSFAWLENLAAKQGATEGLLTKPEERMEQEPEWVRQAKDSAAQQPVQPSAQEEPVIEQPASTDDTAAWLKGLEEEEQKPEPESAADETAIWLKGLAEEEKQSEPVSAADETAVWLKGLEEEEKKPQTEPAADEIEIWLKGLEGEEKQPEPASAADETAIWFKSLEQEEITPAAEPVDADMPAWIKDIEPDQPPAAEPTVPVQKAEPEAAEVPAEEPEVPSWLRDFEKEEKSASQANVDDLPAWLRDETGEVVAEPVKIEPTRPTDWKPAEPKEPEIRYSPPIEEEPQPSKIIYSPPLEEPTPEPEIPAPVMMEEEPPQQPAPPPLPEEQKPVRKTPFQPTSPPEQAAPRGTGMLVTPGIDPTLGNARNELSRSNIPGALESYSRLIKKARFLDEVIYDLREALYRYPVEVNIWQALGDAYMRANRLQDALDAYTKAEELLR